MSILEVALPKVNERGQARPEPGPCQCPESDTVPRGGDLRATPVRCKAGRRDRHRIGWGRPIRPSSVRRAAAERSRAVTRPPPRRFRARPIGARAGRPERTARSSGLSRGPPGDAEIPLGLEQEPRSRCEGGPASRPGPLCALRQLHRQTREEGGSRSPALTRRRLLTGPPLRANRSLDETDR